MAVKTHKEGLGDRRLLDKIDKLRELGVSAQISLPQIVVAGDQSAGKSSVLESLTGFHFPRAVSLCTRHATEIICRREREENVAVSIVPHNPTPEKLEAVENFRREIKSLDEDTVKDIFSDAVNIMGINSGSAFSRDVLRVELSGPEEDHLTVIDIPGMFENPTEGLTTESDIKLVKVMVKEYIKKPRTIILAVAPCNGDIANQKILTYAAQFDPEGRRTLGVLTKPDLVPENATKASIIDLVQGKRKDLHLGYCVVRNRGADDTSSSLEARNAKEKEFFSSAPWNTLPIDRLGISALRIRIQTLLVDRTRAELPKVREEISSKLGEFRAELSQLGQSRASSEEQRKFLGKTVSHFTMLKYCGVDAYYSRDSVFDEKSQLRLVTRIREMNEAFSRVMHEKGHETDFQPILDFIRKPRKASPEAPDSPNSNSLYLTTLSFAITDQHDLDDILAEPFWCPEAKQTFVESLESVYKLSRGSELGTFSGEVLMSVFKAQAKKWQPMALAHVSNAILTVHDFIRTALKESCADQGVQAQLWDLIDPLLRKAYGRAISHVRFLLRVELGGKAMTYNPDFEDTVSKKRKKVAEDLKAIYDDDDDDRSTGEVITSFIDNIEDQKGTGQEIHHVLSSYYDIALGRFIDTVCHQAVDYFLLHDDDGPLNIISDELIYSMTEEQLDEIAGEDDHTRLTRQTLAAEIDRFSKALKVLKAGSAA
ncbi:hypothetical protein N3K66_008988 [Trichothecium roseum]|uniref:Uncharacterized protein n=1 Tax=Trichothecium roseum TaxID=47278 RepID=A0ACC0UPR7_9HYPO|nr:hypothetical protein N3K66_008988 [Trichothecium roseum]